MENEIETYEKQKDNRGFFVECDLSNHFYNIHDISGDSLFLKKTTTNIKFINIFYFKHTNSPNFIKYYHN